MAQLEYLDLSDPHIHRLFRNQHKKRDHSTLADRVFPEPQEGLCDLLFLWDLVNQEGRECRFDSHLEVLLLLEGLGALVFQHLGYLVLPFLLGSLFLLVFQVDQDCQENLGFLEILALPVVQVILAVQVHQEALG